MNEEAMTEYLKARGWEYGQALHGWRWAHRNIVRGVYWTLEAAFEIETVERVSMRGE
jgi:hypothetical protein